MRKNILLALCFLLLGTATFALDMVIGGGVMYGPYSEKYEYPDPADNHEGKGFGYGAYAFFGLTRYMEAHISVHITNYEGYTYPHVGVGFNAKYPFSIANRLVLFPTVGVDFQNNEGGLDLFLGGGGGLDFFLSERLFLRFQALYRYGIMVVYKGDLWEENGVSSGHAHAPLFKLGLGWLF